MSYSVSMLCFNMNGSECVMVMDFLCIFHVVFQVWFVSENGRGFLGAGALSVHVRSQLQNITTSHLHTSCHIVSGLLVVHLTNDLCIQSRDFTRDYLSRVALPCFACKLILCFHLHFQSFSPPSQQPLTSSDVSNISNASAASISSTSCSATSS